MKAYFCHKYGPPEVLKLQEAPKPVPKGNEILVKVFATAVTASDIFIRGSLIPLLYRIPMRIMIGLTRPRRKIIGLVFSGVVEAAGKDIRRFREGDQVYGLTGFRLGTYAEYLCMTEVDSTRSGVALKPETISHEEATAAAYGGLLAFQAMERGKILPGHRVLIYGASGTTGTMAIPLAKYWGATVTAVCSTANLDFVKSLGADKVIDYTTTDDLDQELRFDFMLDAVGKSKSSKLKAACRKALVKGGKYVSIDDGALKLDSDRLVRIGALIDSGYIRPVVGKVYPFEDLVAAHRYVQQGHKRGGVAVTVAGSRILQEKQNDKNSKTINFKTDDPQIHFHGLIHDDYQSYT